MSNSSFPQRVLYEVMWSFSPAVTTDIYHSSTKTDCICNVCVYNVHMSIHVPTHSHKLIFSEVIDEIYKHICNLNQTCH